MEKINKIGIILILAIVSITSSCVSEEGPFFVEIDEPIVVSYSADIQPIFVDRCIQCHERLFRILCQRKITRSISSQIECTIKPAFKEDGQLR